MLEIDKEFRKGILFVRISGILNKSNVSYLNKEVTKLVAEMQICNVCFNLEKLKYIDIDGINAILYNYNLCKSVNGVSILCGVNDTIRNRINNSIIKDMLKIKNEIQAINMVEI